MDTKPSDIEPRAAIATAARNELARISRLVGMLSNLDTDVAAQALRTCGSAQGAARWLLASEHPALPPGTPLELSGTPEGKQAVLGVLNGIAYGNVL